MSAKTEIVEKVIDTEGTTIQDVSDIRPDDRPAFTIAKAVQWARDPANAPRIEQAVQQATEAKQRLVQRIDDRVTGVKDLIVDCLMDDETSTGLFDEFLSSVTGIRD